MNLQKRKNYKFTIKSRLVGDKPYNVEALFIREGVNDYEEPIVVVRGRTKVDEQEILVNSILEAVEIP